MAMAKKMMAKLMPRKMSTVVSTLRCSMRANDCTRANAERSSPDLLRMRELLTRQSRWTARSRRRATRPERGSDACAAARKGAMNRAAASVATRTGTEEIGEKGHLREGVFQREPPAAAAGRRGRPGRPDRRPRPESPCARRRLRRRARPWPGAPFRRPPCGRHRGRRRARRSTA